MRSLLLAAVLLLPALSAIAAAERAGVSRVSPLRTPPSGVKRTLRLGTETFPSLHTVEVENGRVPLTLFGEDILAVVEDHSDLMFGKAKFYTGVVEGVPRSSVELLFDQNGMSGVIRMSGKVYEVLATGKRAVQVSELDPAKTRSTDAHRVKKPRRTERRVHQSLSSGNVTSERQVNNVIDLVVFFTGKVKAENRGVSGTQTRISLMQGDMNSAFMNSGLATRVRVVHSQEVDYNEDRFDWDHYLTKFTGNGDGFMDEVQEVRTRFGGDACMLLVAPRDDEGTAGIAYAPADYEDAYSVVESRYAADIVASHELGHNLGCFHDRNTDPGRESIDWARGYQNLQARIYTVMAYDCNFCDSVNVFSRPGTFEGSKIGDSRHDCTRRIRQYTPVMASFENTVVNPNATPSPSLPPVTTQTPKPTPVPSTTPGTNKWNCVLGPSTQGSFDVLLTVVNLLPYKVNVFEVNRRNRQRRIVRLPPDYYAEIIRPAGTVFRIRRVRRKRCIESFKLFEDREVYLE